VSRSRSPRRFDSREAWACAFCAGAETRPVGAGSGASGKAGPRSGGERESACGRSSPVGSEHRCRRSQRPRSVAACLDACESVAAVSWVYLSPPKGRPEPSGGAARQPPFSQLRRELATSTAPGGSQDARPAAHRSRTRPAALGGQVRPRTIDLDLIAYATSPWRTGGPDACPTRRFAERRVSCAVPFADAGARLMLPGTGRTARDLATALASPARTGSTPIPSCCRIA